MTAEVYGHSWTWESMLPATDEPPEGEFYVSVALSEDGATAIVSAQADTIEENISQGSARVFTHLGEIWVAAARLIASDGSRYCYFGYRSVISAEGTTALICARKGEQVPGVPQGSIGQGAYVYTHSTGGWREQAKLTAPSGTRHRWFGIDGALSADGCTALVGAESTMIGSNTERGAAYVFACKEAVWSLEAVLSPTDGLDTDGFGTAVALSQDGATALVGGGGGRQGAAYVYVRSQHRWSQQAKLTASNGVDYDTLGGAVALSADGSTALVGANNARGHRGSAYMFSRSRSSWTEICELTSSDNEEEEDNFGCDVALSSDGRLALIGAGGKNSARGAAYVFVRSATGWSLEARFALSGAKEWTCFGSSVALAGDGMTAAVSADGDGVAHVFKRVHQRACRRN